MANLQFNLSCSPPPSLQSCSLWRHLDVERQLQGSDSDCEWINRLLVRCRHGNEADDCVDGAMVTSSPSIIANAFACYFRDLL